MVSDMELSNVNGEETRSSSVGSGIVSVAVANCSSARQSPKVTVSMTPSPSALLFQRNSASPSVPRKITGKNHNNTGKSIVFLTSTFDLMVRSFE